MLAVQNCGFGKCRLLGRLKERRTHQPIRKESAMFQPPQAINELFQEFTPVFRRRTGVRMTWLVLGAPVASGTSDLHPPFDSVVGPCRGTLLIILSHFLPATLVHLESQPHSGTLGDRSGAPRRTYRRVGRHHRQRTSRTTDAWQRPTSPRCTQQFEAGPTSRPACLAPAGAGFSAGARSAGRGLPGGVSEWCWSRWVKRNRGGKGRKEEVEYRVTRGVACGRSTDVTADSIQVFCLPGETVHAWC